jgi:predicted DNA-binding protein (UPF0251 family)
MKKRKSFEDRIKKKITKENGHWIWNGCTDVRGIPKIAIIKGTNHSVPRYLFKKWLGKEPLRTRIRNVCGNNMCVNPEHYEEARKSRFRKITDEQVLEILELWRLSELHKQTLEKLAARYGVTKQTIGTIVNRKTRKHAEELVEMKKSLLIDRSIYAD